MNDENPYKEFIARYLARGAIGVSVGLAALAPAAAEQSDPGSQEQINPKPFAERLSTIRSAVSEHLNESLKTAQIIVHPFANAPPFHNVQPFKNFFGKEPFKDTWKNK